MIKLKAKPATGRAKDSKKLSYPAWWGILLCSKQVILRQKVSLCNVWILVNAMVVFFCLFLVLFCFFFILQESWSCPVCLPACSSSNILSGQVQPHSHSPFYLCRKFLSLPISPISEVLGLHRHVATYGKSDSWEKILGWSAWEWCTESINGAKDAGHCVLLGNCLYAGF